MGNVSRPRLDTEDKKLLEYIAKYGFVDMCFVYKFYKTNCRRDTVERRIMQLVKHKLLLAEKMFVPHNYVLTGKDGYKALTLDRLGLEMMEAMGFDVTDYRKTMKDSASYRVYHQVQVATLCESMSKNFNENEKLFRVKMILSEKDACLPERNNQPDAILIFERTDNTPGCIAIFVELERSYTSKNLIHSKLASYATVIRDKSYKKHLKLPIVAQRVLFASQTDSQIETIKKKIEASPFAEEIEILVAKYSEACERSLESIYEQPKTNKKYKLLQNMQK